MATITTSGNLSNLFQSGGYVWQQAGEMAAYHFEEFALGLESASWDVFNGYYYDIGSTPSVLKAQLFYPSSALVWVEGSGFDGSSGRITRISYDYDPLSWEFLGKGSWSLSKGIYSLTLNKLNTWNSDLSNQIFLEGNIKYDQNGIGGTINSTVLLFDDFRFEQHGKVKVSEQPSGIYNSLFYGDSQGSVSVSGKLPVEQFAAIGSLDDLFDSVELFKGKDTFNVIDNSRAWYGFAGNDSMYGGEKSDELHGGSGNDNLYGNSGDDLLYGDDGNDTLDGGAGDDYLNGGAGNDTYNDFLGDNVIVDIGGNNKVTTGNGNDIITTGDGKDTVDAGAGNDRVNVGGGANKVTGGAGEDVFVLDQFARGSVTTVLDFNPLEGDRLELNSSAFSALAGIDDLSGSLVVAGKAKALDFDDFLIFDTKSKKLYYDSDGSGVQAAVEIAVLKGLGELTTADIWIV